MVVIPKVINYEEHLDVEGIPGDCVCTECHRLPGGMVRFLHTKICI